MKTFVLNFKGFVNENYSEDESLRAEEPISSTMPEEVSNLAKFIIDGNFEGHKIIKIEGNSIKLKASSLDFKYAPDTLALRDFGFETWSGKPYDVKLSLEDADPSSMELVYKVSYVEKSAKRAKVDNSEEDFVDDYENQPDEFDDVPEEPTVDKEDIVSKGNILFKDEENLPDDEDDEDEGILEGKKKAVGGFEKLKIKTAPKYSNPNNKARREANKNTGFKGTMSNLMKKDPNKMVDKKTD